MSITAGEFMTLVRNRIGDTSTEGFISDTLLYQFVNEGIFDMNLRTNFLWGTTSYYVYENCNYVEISDANTLKVKRVLWDRESYEEELHWRSWAWLDDTYEGWDDNEKDTPEYFFMYDINRRIYFECPSEVTTTVKIDYVKISTYVNSSDDVLDIEDEMVEALSLYIEMCYLLTELDSQKVREALVKKQEYLDKINSYKRPALHRKRGRQTRLGG